MPRRWRSRQAGRRQPAGRAATHPTEGFPTQRMDMTGDKRLRRSPPEGGLWLGRAAHYRGATVDHDELLEDKGAARRTGGLPMISKGEDLSAQITASSLPLKDGGRSAGTDAFSQDLDDYWPPVAGSMTMGPPPISTSMAGGASGWGSGGGTPCRRRISSTQLGVHNGAGAGPIQATCSPIPDGHDERRRRRRDGVQRARSGAQRRDGDYRHEGGGGLRTFSHAGDSAIRAKTRAQSHERYAWGRGFMSKRHDPRFAGDANSYVGDPTPKPEIGQYLRRDLRLAGGRLRKKAEVTIGGFITLVEDFIDAVKLADRPGGFVFLHPPMSMRGIAGIDDGPGGCGTMRRPASGTLTVSAVWVEGKPGRSGDLPHATACRAAQAGSRSARCRAPPELELVAGEGAVDDAAHERSRTLCAA